MELPGFNESKSILKGGVRTLEQERVAFRSEGTVYAAYWPAMDSARYLYSPNNTAIRSLGNLAASSGDRSSRVEITAKYGPI